MSKKDYESKCLDLTQACTKEEDHSSLMNLKQISKGLKQILAQSSETSSDWKKFKKVHSQNFGYLSSAVNNPEIGKEVKLISELVDSFNKIKENLEEYTLLLPRSDDRLCGTLEYHTAGHQVR